MSKFTDADIKRFWSRVDKKSEDACWEWEGYRNIEGYGRITINSKLHLVHRVSWIIHNGEIPDGNLPYGTMFICHTCDNPSCVNPAHLFIGTNKDNMRDKNDKGRGGGRGLKGEENSMHKLTECQVKEIREKYEPRVYTLDMLAAEYGVTFQHIQTIITNKAWRHLPLTPAEKMNKQEYDQYSKIPKEILTEILAKYVPYHYSQAKIAQEYNLSVGCVRGIIRVSKKSISKY